MLLRKLPAQRTILLVLSLFFITCSEDEPEVFGNDGALLVNIRVDNSAAFISTIQNKIISSPDNIPYSLEQLFSVNQDGVMDEAQFTITGTGGGFDKYVVHDINEKYFLISFYLRNESYFIEKTTGNAFKTAFVNTRDLTMYGGFHSRSNYVFYGVHNTTDFYFKDFDNDWFHVRNFLSGEAIAEPINFGTSSPERIYFDSKGGLYFHDQYSFYYHSNATSSLVIQDPVGIFNDLNGNLYVVEENGKVSSLLNGTMSNAFTVPGQVYPWDAFAVFHFESSGKSLAIYSPNNGSPTLVFDINKKVKQLELKNKDDNSFSIITADAYKNFLVILHQVGDKVQLRMINVTTNQFSDVDVTGLALSEIDTFCSISEDLILMDICRIDHGIGGCYKDIKTLKSSGITTSIAGNEMYGKIIAIN
jgi:hypothetical protein